MPKADPFAQRRLLELAAVDKAVNNAQHRRRTLPELALLESGGVKLADLRKAQVVAETQVADLDRASKKLDNEIDQVRARTKRDADRLAAGSGGAKDLENLQHELTSLARRQGTLEDELLEFMEQRETANFALTAVLAEVAAVRAANDAAGARRDDAFADIDQELGRLRAARSELVGSLPSDLVALYERIAGTGKIAAGQLHGSRCEACRIDLDNVELAEIRAAKVDEVVRCPECGAILVRS